MNNKELLKQTLKANQNLVGVPQQLRDANAARKAWEDANGTNVGSIAGEVVGGVESIGSKFDRFQNKLNTTTTAGVLNSASKSVENLTTSMVDDPIGNIKTKATSFSKVTLSNFTIRGRTVSLPSDVQLEDVGGAKTTIKDVLGNITGLDIGAGDLQAQVLDASPDGLLRAGARVKGKIGAFSASAINELLEETITSVTDVIEAAGAPVATTTKVYTSAVDSDGNETTENVTRNTENVADRQTEFAAAIEEAKTKALNSIAGIVTEDKETKQNLVEGADDFSELSGGKKGSTVLTAAQRQQALRNSYQALSDAQNSAIQSRVAGNSQNGVLQSLSIKTITDIRRLVKDFAPKLSNDNVTRVIDLSQGDSIDFSEAVDILFKSTGKPADEIRAFLRRLDTSITRATRPAIETAVFDQPYVIGSFAESWNGGQGDPVFPYISSVEELQAELRNVTREVTEVVVHWTETPTNKNIGSEEINAIHLENGLNGIGYHYIIRRDGSLQRGRPVNIQGQHAIANGHDNRSISIAFVGGFNVPSETRNIQNFLSVQSLNRSQFNTFDHFCRAFYNVFSGGQIVGHSDLDELASDPGFDVRAYVKANFDKDSKFTAPLKQAPFTVDEINS